MSHLSGGFAPYRPGFLYGEMRRRETPGGIGSVLVSCISTVSAVFAASDDFESAGFSPSMHTMGGYAKKNKRQDAESAESKAFESPAKQSKRSEVGARPAGSHSSNAPGA